MHICIYTHSPHSILYNHMNGYIGLWTITTLESSRAPGPPGPGTSPRSPGHIMASMVACFCASSLSFACLSCASQHQSTVKIGQRCHAGFNCQTRKGFWFLGCILFSGMNQQELCQKTEKKGKCKICKQKYESSLEMPFHCPNNMEVLNVFSKTLFSSNARLPAGFTLGMRFNSTPKIWICKLGIRISNPRIENKANLKHSKNHQPTT